MDQEMQKSVKTLVKLGIIVLSLLSVYLLLHYLLPYIGIIFGKAPSLLLPFIIALVIAMMVEPVVVFFESKLGLKRSWAVLISLLLFLGLIFSAFFFIVFKLSTELVRLSPAIINYSGDVGRIIIDSVSEIRLYFLAMELPLEVQQTLHYNWEAGVSTLLNNLLTGCINILTQLPNMMITIVIAAIATFFLVKDRVVINKFIWRKLPRRSKVRIKRISDELYKSLVGFVKAYSILVTITAIVTMIALTLLRVENAFTISIIAGILDLLPIVGTGLIFVPWIIWELFLGSKSMGVSLLVIYVMITVIRQVLEPKITGDNIGLHPLSTLLSMYIGLKLIGFMGIILGPATLVVILAVNRAGLLKKRKVGVNK